MSEIQLKDSRSNLIIIMENKRQKFLKDKKIKKEGGTQDISQFGDINSYNLLYLYNLFQEEGQRLDWVAK